MSYLSRRLSVSIGAMIFWLIAIIVCIAVVMVVYIDPTDDAASSSSKLFAISAGLLSGLVVMLGQYVIEWKRDSDLELFRKTRIKDVLITRSDEAYYSALVSSSTFRIDVLGVTASRFLEDFASENNPRPEKRVLLDALQRKVNVRILLPDREFLLTEKDKHSHDVAKARMASLANQFPGLFHYRYFSHRAAHSIVVVDSDCLLGPVFPNVDSKVTPAVRSEVAGDFSAPYLRYFASEWDAATEPT